MDSTNSESESSGSPLIASCWINNDSGVKSKLRAIINNRLEIPNDRKNDQQTSNLTTTLEMDTKQCKASNLEKIIMKIERPPSSEPRVVKSSVSPSDRHVSNVTFNSTVQSFEASHRSTTELPLNRTAIRDLIRILSNPDTGRFPKGVSPKDIFDHWARASGDAPLTKSRNHLQVLLWRDVKSGKIKRVGMGSYTVPEFFNRIVERRRQDGDPVNPYNQQNNTTNNHNKEKSKTKRRTKIAQPVSMAKLVQPIVDGVVNSNGSMLKPIRLLFTTTNRNLVTNGQASTGCGRQDYATQAQMYNYRCFNELDGFHGSSSEQFNTVDEVIQSVSAKNSSDVEGDAFSFLPQTTATVPIMSPKIEQSENGNAPAHRSPINDVVDEVAKNFKTKNDDLPITDFNQQQNSNSPKPKRKTTRKTFAIDNASQNLAIGKADQAASLHHCSMCHGYEPSGDDRQSMLCCSRCDFKAHPSCLGYNEPMTERCRKYSWQCTDCKFCCICLKANNPETLLLCDNCDRGYHMHCHQPIIFAKPEGEWCCGTCRLLNSETHAMSGIPGADNRESLIEQTVNAVCRKHPSPKVGSSNESLHSANSDFFSNIDNNPLIREAASEVGRWTVDQVYKFIMQLGFPEQAVAFRREEIDGQALLLLERNDVLSMLSLKLGPALKIHRRVSALQMLALGYE